MKHLLDEVSEAERKAVTQWIGEDAANQLYYLQLKQVWDSSKELAVESAVDEHKAWDNFQRRVNRTGVSKKAGILSRLSWVKIAASVILLAGLPLCAYLLLNRQNDFKEVTAQTLQNVLTDTLSDGSVVTLNKKSSITYQKTFKGDKRAVALKGEAFFVVTPDKKRPFVITVNDVQVAVVGTSFNVKSEKENIEVVVETGVVQVSREGRTVELKAGEKLRMPAAGSVLEKEAVTDHLYNYYRTREFVCDDTPLWKLVEVLNKAYDADIIIGSNELKDLKINTTFYNESLDKILEIIHLTFDIKITRKDGQVILQ